MPKAKSHKGLLKRVRVTAKGKIKFKGAHSGHLRSKKTGKKIRAIRRKKIAKPSDVLRFEKMLQTRLHRPDPRKSDPRKSDPRKSDPRKSATPESGAQKSELGTKE